MADLSYIKEIGEAWEFLDIWAAGGNAEAKKLLAALKSALGHMGSSLNLFANEAARASHQGPGIVQ